MLDLTKVHWRRGGAGLVQRALILAALGSSVLKPNLNIEQDYFNRHSLLMEITVRMMMKMIMMMSHLDPGLAEPQFLTEFLPHESVRVVSLVKQPLQTVELLQTGIGYRHYGGCLGLLPPRPKRPLD